MSDPSPSDTFLDRARSIASVVIFVAGVLALVGSLLDWVVITELPGRIPADQRDQALPFAGIEADDGIITASCGAAMVLLPIGLVLRRRSLYAWLTFMAAVTAGAVSIGAYRSIQDLFAHELDRIGEAEPAFGLSVVIAGGVLGVIGSVAGIAATPYTPDYSGSTE